LVELPTLLFFSIFIFYLIVLFFDFKEISRFKNFKPLILTFLIIAFHNILYVPNKLFNKYRKSPSLIVINYHTDLGHTQIDLKEDGRFIFSNGALFYEDLVVGKYSLDSNIIFLDSTKMAKTNFERRYIMMPCTRINGIIRAHEVSEDDTIRYSYSRFIVSEDNR